MIIDVDHFKRINDTFGHTAGDQVLVSIGSALKQSVRQEDFVARLGGDEFAVILDGLHEQNASQVGDRIRSTIELFDFEVGDERGSTTVVTLSMGLATAVKGDSKATLFERADQALYKSKELGRNRLYTIRASNKDSNKRLPGLVS
jgi:diguanylate cyclase